MIIRTVRSRASETMVASSFNFISITEMCMGNVKTILFAFRIHLDAWVPGSETQSKIAPFKTFHCELEKYHSHYPRVMEALH